jgi:hypothetical protein
MESSLRVTTGEVLVTAYERNASGDEQGTAREREEQPRTHISATGLRGRGWTPGMVRRLLGEPDLLTPSPVSRAAPKTRLYRLERVEAVERSEEFRAVAAAAARRSAVAKAAAYRRRREVLTRIAAEPIDVPRLAPDRLATLAVEHRDRQGEERLGPAGVEDADPSALARWKVNYLRHQLTRYGELLDGLHASTGRAAAEALLRRRVYAAIEEAYPDLAQECERQLAEGEYGPPPG